MPLRNVPFGIGVNTTPSLAMNTLELASSATLPSHVADDAIVEAARARLQHGARVVGIEAAGLGVDRRGLDGRPPERRQRDREAVGLAHRRVVEREAPAGRFRIGRQRLRPGALGPVHRPDVERRVRRRTASCRRATSSSHCSAGHRGLEKHGLGRGVDARAVQVEVGRDALERARAVEHRGAEPDRVGAHAPERHVALVPFALEEGPGLATRPRPSTFSVAMLV